jgi:hypothetical protein
MACPSTTLSRIATPPGHPDLQHDRRHPRADPPAGPGAVILKRDLKDAFRNIPVALEDRRLLGFIWELVVYTECCLPFGLATAPLIFNLFAEALHWVLEKHLHPVAAFFALAHYLDDFIFILRPGADPAPVIRIYDAVIARLGFPPTATKDSCGSVSDVLGYRVDTNTLMISLPPAKQNDLIFELASFVKRSCASHKQCEKLAGSLAWAAKVVDLGRSYSRSLWDFIVTKNTCLLGVSHYLKSRMPINQ